MPDFYVTGDVFLPKDPKPRLSLDIHPDNSPPDLQDAGLVASTLRQWEALRSKRFITPRDIRRYNPVIFTLDYVLSQDAYKHAPALEWGRQQSSDIMISGSMVYPYHMARLVRELTLNPAPGTAAQAGIYATQVA